MKLHNLHLYSTYLGGCRINKQHSNLLVYDMVKSMHQSEEGITCVLRQPQPRGCMDDLDIYHGGEEMTCCSAQVLNDLPSCLEYCMFNIANFILLQCVGQGLFYIGRPRLNITCGDFLCYIYF